MHPIDAEQLLAVLNPLAPAGQVRTATLRLRAADGAWTHGAAARPRRPPSAQTVDVALGEPGGSEQAVDAFERVFASSPIGMAVVSDGIVRRINRRMAELLGEDRTGARARALVGADDLEMVREQLARLVARELHAVTLKLDLRHADGTALPVEFSVSLLRDDAGEPRQYIVQVQDVAETEQLEEEIRHADEPRLADRPAQPRRAAAAAARAARRAGRAVDPRRRRARRAQRHLRHGRR